MIACCVLAASCGLMVVTAASPASAGACSRPAQVTVVRLHLTWSGRTPTVQAHKGDVLRVRATAPKGYGDTLTYPAPIKRAWAVCHIARWRSGRSAIATFLVIHVPAKPVVFSSACQHPSPALCIDMFGRARIHPRS